MTDPIRVLIVDDEPLARQRLDDLLRDIEDVEVLALIDNGRAAVEAIETLRPDLVFLDIQMPGMTGPDVVRALKPEDVPLVIFVTAYDQYALQAFDLAALDYLLKPFDDERFEQTLERARQQIRLRTVDKLRDRLLALLNEPTPTSPSTAAAPAPAETPDYLERLAVEMRGQVRIVPVDKIDYISASGPYVELHVGDQTYLIRERMQTLESRLNPEAFFRIHRSAIVRLAMIDVLLHNTGGDYAVQLKNGKRLKVSRSRREALAERLGVR